MPIHPHPMSGPGKRHVRALVFYIIAVSIIFAPVVFGNKTLQPPLYQPNGLVNGWPNGYRGRLSINTYNVDLPTPAYYEWPVNKTIGDMYKRGELPLWNPYQAAGTPLLADYSSRAFFPYQALIDVSPVELWDFLFLGRHVIAGLFTYLFLSLCGLSFLPAFLGGLFYMFGGTLVWFINLEQFANVAMTLPLTMFLTESFAQRRGWRETALLGVGYALTILAGQPEAALYVFYISAAYIVFRTLYLHGPAFAGAGGATPFLKTCLKAVLALVIGLCLSSPLILPFLENAYYSHHLHPLGLDIGTAFDTNWLRAFAILTPSATELPADPSILPEVLVKVSYNYGASGYYRVFATNGVWDYLGGYTGVMPMFLVLIAIILAIYQKTLKRHGMLLFFLGFGLSIVLKNFGVAPFLWLGRLPFFDQAWSQRWSGPSWVFAFAVAGAFAMSAIMDARLALEQGRSSTAVSPKDRTTLAVLTAFILFALMMAIVPLPGIIDMAVNRHAQFSPLLAPYVIPSMVGGYVVAFIVLTLAFVITYVYLKTGRGVYSLIVLAASELWWNVPRGYDHEWLYYKFILFAVGVVAVILLLTLKGEKARTASAVAMPLLFLALFMWMDSTSPYGFPERFNPFKHEPPYMEFLKRQDGGFRVMGGYGILTPNYAGTEGIYDLRYINALVSKEYRDFRYDKLLVEDIDSAEREGTALWFTGMPQWITLNFDEKMGRHYHVINRGIEKDITTLLPNYSFMGVRYFLMPRFVDLNKGSAYPLLLVYDKEVRIYQNPYAFPRSFVVDLEPDAFKAIERLDPKVANITLDTDLFDLKTGRKGVKGAEIKKYGANEVEIEAIAQRPGMLVLSDVLGRGWKARVNGEETPIYKVNGTIRGVLLKDGLSSVVFHYMPRSFKAGLVLFALSATAAILMIIRCRKTP